jgi:hypothetical protein
MRRVLIEGRWKLALIDYFTGDTFLEGVFAIPQSNQMRDAQRRQKKTVRWSSDNVSAQAQL